MGNTITQFTLAKDEANLFISACTHFTKHKFRRKFGTLSCQLKFAFVTNINDEI